MSLTSGIFWVTTIFKLLRLAVKMKVNIERVVYIPITNLRVRYKLKENIRGDAVLFQGKQDEKYR
jgi:hypothetical protein